MHQIPKCLGKVTASSSYFTLHIYRKSGRRPQTVPGLCDDESVWLSGIIIITDGVTSVPDVAMCETLLNQLRSGTIACSFVQVSVKCVQNCQIFIIQQSGLLFVTTCLLRLVERTPTTAALATSPMWS